MEDESGFEVWSFEVDDEGAPEGELGLLGDEGGGGVGGVGCEGGVAQAARARQARAQRLLLRVLFMGVMASICCAEFGRRGGAGVSCTVAESC